MEQKDREIALLNEQLAKLQHMEATPDNKVNGLYTPTQPALAR